MKGSLFDFISEMEFYFFLFVILVISALIKFLPFSLPQQDWGFFFKNLWLLLPDYAVIVMSRIIPFSFFLSLVLIVFIIWVSNRIIHVRNKMHAALEAPGSAAEVSRQAPPPVINEKWQKVLVHINSDNPSDWKLAILECDIMLAEILEKMGYTQPSISEKLKSIEVSDFVNIESAWEAHKIRNSIAHEGSEFLINEREAKRVIGLYEVVFREFAFI